MRISVLKLHCHFFKKISQLHWYLMSLSLRYNVPFLWRTHGELFYKTLRWKEQNSKYCLLLIRWHKIKFPVLASPSHPDTLLSWGEWCAGKYLTTDSSGVEFKRKPCLAVFIHFHDVNTPNMGKRKLPAWLHWTWSLEEMDKP